jgi:16S rRNA processing protein RimM
VLSSNKEGLVTIARIARPRGLKGEVSADLLTDFPDRFTGLVDVTLVSENGERRAAEIEKSWFQKDRVILKFAGIDSIDDAEFLRNTDVCVPEADAVPLEEDDFYDWQLEGCRVETLDGASLGTVGEILRTGGTDLLVVRGGEKEYLIPLAASICVDISIEDRVIRIDPPEGLLEF